MTKKIAKIIKLTKNTKNGSLKKYASKKLELFRLPSKEAPFETWMNKLNLETRVKINAYLLRVCHGGAKKNIRSLNDRIFEIKISSGPGYRVYFGEKESKIILLLLGGDKGSQKRDILKAKGYWRIYNESK